MRIAILIAVSSCAASFQASANTISPQEQMACLKETESAGTACHEASYAAAAQANQIAVQNGALAGKDSLNQAADREAAATKKIAEILSRALSTCQAQLKNCTSSCPGEYGALGEACARDVGKYIDQLSSGRAENIEGRKGSLLSDAGSTGRAGSGEKYGTAGGVGPTGYKDLPPEVQKPVGGSNPVSYKNLGPQTQKPVGASNAGGNESDGSNSHGTSGHGGNTNNGTFNSAGGIATAAVNLEVPGDYHEVRRNLLKKTLQGKALESALLQYCETSGARDSECGRIVTEYFCASPEKAGCPSCQKKSPSSYSQAEMPSVCVAACVKDPQYGPQLADRCRSVLKPLLNEEASALEVAGAHGTSIFAIVSRAINKRCLEGKLRCGN